MPRSSSAHAAASDRVGFYKEITDRIITELKAGRLPWVQLSGLVRCRRGPPLEPRSGPVGPDCRRQPVYCMLWLGAGRPSPPCNARLFFCYCWRTYVPGASHSGDKPSAGAPSSVGAGTSPDE